MRYCWMICMVVLCLRMNAQWPACPAMGSSNWGNEQAYQRAQDTIVQVAKWLCDTPISVDYDQRAWANAYVIKWMVNHPTKKFDADTKCFGPIDGELDLMYAYLQALLCYQLTHDVITREEQDEFILQTLAKKILQSEQYSEREEWKKMTRAYQHKRERKYLAKCHKENNP